MTRRLHVSRGKLGRGSTEDVRIWWRTCQLARFDLFVHRKPWWFFWILLAITLPAVTLAQIGGAIAALDPHHDIALAALFGGTVAMGSVLLSMVLHHRRVFYRPAATAAIAALRQLVEPRHWAWIARQSGNWEHLFPRKPITISTLFVWLD